MKTLIFLIFIAPVFYAVFWYLRKSQAEADLARHESRKRVKKVKKDAITAEAVTWPTVGLSEDDDPEEETDYEGPTMATIEFVSPEK